MLRIVELDRLAVEQQLAVFVRIESEYGAEQFASACADQTGEADDLACVDVERDVLETAAGEVLDPKNRITDRRRGFRELVGDLSTNHLFDDAVLVDLVDAAAVNILAVTEDRDFVADLKDLVHLVGDVDDADALLLQAADVFKQDVDLGVRDGRGRLIHDDDRCVTGNRLDDLDQRDVGYGQVAHEGFRVVMEAKFVHQCLRICPKLFPVYHFRRIQRLTAEENVFSDRHVEDRAELLMDGCDTHLKHGLRSLGLDLFTLEEDVALVSLVNTVDDLHQRRFACAVLTAQGVNAARSQLQVDLVQRLYARKRFGYAAKLQNVFVVLRCQVPCLLSLTLF